MTRKKHRKILRECIGVRIGLTDKHGKRIDFMDMPLKKKFKLIVEWV